MTQSRQVSQQCCHTPCNDIQTDHTKHGECHSDHTSIQEQSEQNNGRTIACNECRDCSSLADRDKPDSCQIAFDWRAFLTGLRAVA